MVQTHHGAFVSLSDDASREVEKHRSASCEGWAPAAREPARRRAPASQHAPSEKPQAERIGYPSESPRWRIGRRPTPSCRPRHRARQRGRAVSRLEAAQDGAESCQPRLNDPRISLFGASTLGGGLQSTDNRKRGLTIESQFTALRSSPEQIPG